MSAGRGETLEERLLRAEISEGEAERRSPTVAGEL